MSGTFESSSSSSNSGAIVVVLVAVAEGTSSKSPAPIVPRVEHFEALGIAPSQLHPNGWAVLQAFRVLCRGLKLIPSAPVFLSNYTVRMGKKVGWVSLAPLPNTSLFNAYTMTYKGFKGRFIKIQAVGGASFCLDFEPMPLYWRLPLKAPTTPRDQLSLREKAIFRLLDELPRAMNCKELVSLVFEDDPLDYLKSLLKKKSIDIDALIRRS
ncbi:hypothetical protein CR513_06507, partial [Mucuna pruriens]